ncbi:hypothetical protein [Streptomyces sp. NPDC055210]
MGYPLYREVKKWAPDTLTHREKLVAMVLADDANDVTRETHSSAVDPDILRFSMIKNDRDMRKVLTRLVEEKVLDRVTIGGNGRTAKYRLRYLAPAGTSTVAGPNRTCNDPTDSDVAGPEGTSNSGVAGPNETPNSDTSTESDVPKKTGYSGVAGPNRNSCRSESDLPTPSTSSTTSSTTSAAAAAETDSASGTLFDEPGPAPAAKKPKRRAAASSEPTDPEAFDAFWKAFPRRVEKQDTVRAWNKAVAAGTLPDKILRTAQAYAIERRGEDPKFTKYPATWLNKGCYDDEPTPPGPIRGAQHRPYQNPENPDAYFEDL